MRVPRRLSSAKPTTVHWRDLGPRRNATAAGTISRSALSSLAGCAGRHTETSRSPGSSGRPPPRLKGGDVERVLLDAAGHRRSRATMPGYQGRATRGPADDRGDRRRHAGGWRRSRRRSPAGPIVIPWRAGLRISEELDLAETDLDPSRGAINTRHQRGARAESRAGESISLHDSEHWVALGYPVQLLERRLG